MIYSIQIPTDKYKEEILKFLVLNTGLTKSEFNVLLELINLGLDYVDGESRNYLRNTLNKSEHNINNYIMKLKEKKVLIETIDGLIINPNIITMINDRELTFEFISYTAEAIVEDAN